MFYLLFLAINHDQVHYTRSLYNCLPYSNVNISFLKLYVAGNCGPKSCRITKPIIGPSRTVLSDRFPENRSLVVFVFLAVTKECNQWCA